ncbi:hypothetical protein OG21DRAFT_1370171, partial [Imleria badia]
FVCPAPCCHLAGKAEESPVYITNVVAEARLLFCRAFLGFPSVVGVRLPSDNSKLTEMEFCLVADLECDLVFHPYRTLAALCKKESVNESTAEAGEVGEVGTEVDDGQRYWGTGERQLELSDDPLQLAWSIINDTYRFDLCLLYPPHLAITALHLTLVLHAPTRDLVLRKSSPNLPNAAHNNVPRRSSRQASNSSMESKKPQDIIGFFAGLNVSMSLVATIAQRMISFYSAWERYRED